MRIARALTLAAAAAALAITAAGVRAENAKQKCPVSGHEFAPDASTPTIGVNGQKLQLCCANCIKPFAANPEKYIKDAGKCPVAGSAAKAAKASRVVVNNDLYYTCCAGCNDPLAKTPTKFAKELRDPVSGKKFAPKADSPHLTVQGQHYVFESAESKAAFEKDSAKYIIAYK